MKHLVFVFGSLKEGFPNFATNKGTRLPGEFLIKERFPFYLVGERYSPWLVNAPGEGERICGQVFEVGQNFRKWSATLHASTIAASLKMPERLVGSRWKSRLGSVA